MSYDIYLHDPVSKQPIEFDFQHDFQGGTYRLGGCREAWLNVTYNYSAHYRRAFNNDKGIRTIYGMSGAESIPVLEAAASQLGDEISQDYWEATEGNAKRPLLQLAAMARVRPDGIWDGD